MFERIQITVHTHEPIIVHNDGDNKELKRQVSLLQDSLYESEKSLNQVREDRDVAERTLREMRFQLADCREKLELITPSGELGYCLVASALSILDKLGVSGRKLPATTQDVENVF